MIVVYIILLLFAFYFYAIRRRAETLFFLTAITNSCFFFINGDYLSVKPSDFALVFIAIISLLNVQSKEYYKIANDPLGKIIFTILLYFSLNFIATIIFGLENPANAFKVIRPYYALLLYFYVKNMQKQEIRRYFHLMLIASIIQGVFYYLQMVGFEGILAGRVDEAEENGGLTRYANFPKMASFFVLYYIIRENISMRKKGFLISFFCLMLIFGQMRGAIIALSCATGLFFLLKHKTKYVWYIAVGMIVYQFIVSPMFEYRTRNSAHSTSEEITKILKDPTSVYKNYTEEGEGGTFSFRIAMLFERIYYMMENPQYAPLGVGCIHEESPQNTWTFYLGTENQQLLKGYSMLSSADIEWVGLLMRFGIIGVLLWFIFFYYWGSLGIPLVKKSNDAMFMASSVMVISVFLASFDSENLTRVSAIISLMFYLAVIYEYRNRKDDSLHHKIHQSL